MLTGIVLFFLTAETLLVAFLFLDNRRRRRAREILSKRYSLEKTISEFSANLSATAPNKLDATIDEGMRKILDLVGAGRICWYVKQELSTYLERGYSAKVNGVTDSPPAISSAEIPYVFNCLMRGETVVLQSLNDLPPEAKQDREFFRDKSIGSLLLIPSNSGTSSKGVLGLASFSAKNDWTHELISQLGVVGNLIVSTFERKQVYELLQESEQRFRRLFHEAPIGIALEDSRGTLLFVNPALCSMLGYEEKELRGLRCADFTDHEDPNDEPLLLKKLQTGSLDSYKIEKRMLRKDGTRIWGRVNVSMLKNRSGATPLVIGMVEDITEQKRAEEDLRGTQLELQQLTGRLIQVQDEERKSISRELHDDIGQRLSLLTIELDVLGRSLADVGREQERQHAALLQGQADEMTKDIQQLSHELHSSKLQHLGLRAALGELCKHVSRKHKVVMNISKDDPIISLPPELELCFFRVAQEALNNVMKHSKAERVSVELSTTGRVARLQISDTGVGFDPSNRSQGIGLVSMRERLRMLGGELVLNSTQGEGTQVKAEVGLPIRNVENSSAA